MRARKNTKKLFFCYNYNHNMAAKGGFTLIEILIIEILIVVAIIAILAVTTIVILTPGQRLAEARDSRRERDLIALESAVYVEWLDENRLHPNIPTAGEGEDPEDEAQEICNTNIEGVDCDANDLVDLSSLTTKYLATIPVDPHGGINQYGTGYEIVFVSNPKVALRAPKNETRGVAVGHITACYYASESSTAISWEVPVGAEGYDKDGNLEISEEATGTLEDTAGMVVFKTAKGYGDVVTSGGTFEVLVVGGGGAGGSGQAGAGGGGGGLLYDATLSVETSPVAVSVGAAGGEQCAW
jgi:type II secretory pathway pseudopilin PulG